MTPEPGRVVAKRFTLVRELGRGTMGTVWLAEHRMLGVPCAVKFMTAEAARDRRYLARFEREARAIARLRSPHVVRILDYDVSEGVPFIAMEHLDGEDLAARLHRERRLGAEETHRIVTQVAAGVAHAHAAAIVHRDLKPGNVFLAREPGRETAKLLDFGVAKSPGSAARSRTAGGTQAGTLLGTPAYMSPEQARGLPVDHRADLWSLAVIAYECLTGQLPFDGNALADLFAKLLLGPVPVPSEVEPSCPPGFDGWWKRATAGAIDDRFDDAREMAEALGRALGVTPEAPAFEPQVTPGAPALEREKVGSHAAIVLPQRAAARPEPPRRSRVRPARRREGVSSFLPAAALCALAAFLASGRFDAGIPQRADVIQFAGASVRVVGDAAHAAVTSQTFRTLQGALRAARASLTVGDPPAPPPPEPAATAPAAAASPVLAETPAPEATTATTGAPDSRENSRDR